MLMHRHLWPAHLFDIFLHYLTKSRIFRKKKVTEHKVRVLILFTTFDGNILHSTKNWARYDAKCLRMCMCVSIYIYIYIYNI